MGRRMNNWEAQGFKTQADGLAHVLACLKGDEKVIVGAGLSSYTMITIGDYQMILGKMDPRKGIPKRAVKKKKK